MYNLSIPKEYLLEEESFYNPERFRLHLLGCLSISNFQKIYEGDDSLLKSFFKKEEHKEVCIDILKYVMDREEHLTKEVIIKRLIKGMYDAGFFG